MEHKVFNPIEESLEYGRMGKFQSRGSLLRQAKQKSSKPSQIGAPKCQFSQKAKPSTSGKIGRAHV